MIALRGITAIACLSLVMWVTEAAAQSNSRLQRAMRGFGSIARDILVDVAADVATERIKATFDNAQRGVPAPPQPPIQPWIARPSVANGYGVPVVQPVPSPEPAPRYYDAMLVRFSRLRPGATPFGSQTDYVGVIMVVGNQGILKLYASYDQGVVVPVIEQEVTVVTAVTGVTIFYARSALGSASSDLPSQYSYLKMFGGGITGGRATDANNNWVEARWTFLGAHPL
jgi:hypothetical protein